MKRFVGIWRGLSRFPKNQRARARAPLAEFRNTLEKLVVASAKVLQSAAELEGPEAVRDLEGAFAKHLDEAKRPPPRRTSAAA